MSAKDSQASRENRHRIMEAIVTASDGLTVSEIAGIVGLSDYTVRRHLALMDRKALGITLVGGASNCRYCAAERADDVRAKLKVRTLKKSVVSWRSLKAQGREEELQRLKERNKRFQVEQQHKAYFGERIVRPAAKGLDPVETTAPNSVFALGMSRALQPEE